MTFPKAIYFHEDDYCQIEILPFSLWDYCVAEIKKIEEFSAAHQTEFGWTDIYLRNEPPKSLSDLLISKDALRETVEKTLTPFSKVSTGYGSYVEDCSNTLAWGIAERDFTIFANVADETRISVVWLDFGILTTSSLSIVLETFRNLPKANELMIADWKWSEVAYIVNNESLQKYLNLHMDSD